jgi:hypothetical protein
MLKSFIRACAGLLVAASLGLSVVPARADNGDALAAGVVSGANTAIRNAMNQPAQPKTVTKRQDGQASTVAQVPPVSQQPVGGQAQAGLPTGFNYFADFSIAKPFGDIGDKTNWLQGGMDAMASWGFSPTSRVVASYYELQHYPYGFNSGTVPLYLPPGFPASSCESLSGKPSGTCPGVSPTLDLTTKDKFLLLSYEELITLGKVAGRSIPVVITPTYVSRWSQINQSGFSGSDVVPFVNPVNGEPVTGVPTRSAQYDSVAVTLPFLKTPRMFGTFTVAPTWLTHLNGVNQSNNVQLYQIMYLEYNVNRNLRVFLEPQSSRDYLPTDPYPQHLAAYFFGATQRIGKNGFVQAVLNSGGPTNYSPYGVKYFQCYALPCSANTVPAIGGLKATQLQLQFGVGSPVVLPI